jgi:hypothetical protein
MERYDLDGWDILVTLNRKSVSLKRDFQSSGVRS